MRSAGLITLALFAGQTRAQDVDKLLGRANQAQPLDNAELDDTTLGKSHTSVKSMLAPTNLFATAPRTAPAARTNAGSLVTSPRAPLTTSGFASRTVAAPLNTPSLRGDSVRQVRMFAEAAPTITAAMVKELRESTGAGMLDCKKALQENNGDMEEAVAFLRKKGLASAEKRSGKSTNQGIVEAYIHGSTGVMVEVQCETDFVAKTPEFKEFARNLAMQVVASPTVEVVDEEQIPEEWIAKEKAILAESDDMKGKPENIVANIVEGRIAKMKKTKSLVDQPYIKNPDETVQDYLKATIAKFGENIKIARFAKMEVGR